MDLALFNDLMNLLSNQSLKDLTERSKISSEFAGEFGAKMKTSDEVSKFKINGPELTEGRQIFQGIESLNIHDIRIK